MSGSETETTRREEEEVFGGRITSAAVEIQKTALRCVIRCLRIGMFEEMDDGVWWWWFVEGFNFTVIDTE